MNALPPNYQEEIMDFEELLDKLRLPETEETVDALQLWIHQMLFSYEKMVIECRQMREMYGIMLARESAHLKTINDLSEEIVKIKGLSL